MSWMMPPTRLRCQKFFGMTLLFNRSLAYHCTMNRLLNMKLPVNPKIVHRLIPPCSRFHTLSKKAASKNMATGIGGLLCLRKQNARAMRSEGRVPRQAARQAIGSVPRLTTRFDPADCLGNHRIGTKCERADKAVCSDVVMA